MKTRFVVFSGGLLHSHFLSSLLVYSTCVYTPFSFSTSLFTFLVFREGVYGYFFLYLSCSNSLVYLFFHTHLFGWVSRFGVVGV